jgi:DNA-binding transcriptional MerR regulator
MTEEPLDPNVAESDKATEEGRSRTYHSISEVSERLDVRPHVLRYWETQFPTLRPRKGRSGSRMYRDKDIEVLERIKTLLYEKGFTIKGARRRLRLEARKDPPEGQLALGIENPWLEGIAELREELVSMLGILRGRRPEQGASSEDAPTGKRST